MMARTKLVAASVAVAAFCAWSVACTGAPVFENANVLLVTIDTLRADRLGSYGYSGADTPHLDHLATEGLRFDQAVSPVPLTLPSHTSLMTSSLPPAHGVRDNGETASPYAPSLARSLSEAGWATGAFVGAYVLDSRWGLDGGFGHYDDRFDHGAADAVPGQVERRAGAVVDAAERWLEGLDPGPWFAWAHVYDPHTPYEAPEPWGTRFAQRPYDGEVAYVDSVIGRLLDGLEERGVLDETIVVVTSDHGESLGEHQEPGHGLFVYDATQRVPLILRLPDGRGAGVEVGEQVRLIDVAPTILELVGVDPPEQFAGTSLVPFIEGNGAARPAYAETWYPRLHFGWQELFALRRDGFKYILAPRAELYDLREDPGETRNLVDQRPDLAAEMRSTLEELRGDPAATGSTGLSAEAARSLRSLGYIGRAPADLPEGPLPDPKDKVGLYRDLTEGQSLLQNGEPAAAAELLAGVVAEDDTMVDAHLTLGNALFALGRFEEAASAYQRAVELSPDYDIALANLAMTHRRVGETETARTEFETLLELDPENPSAHFHLGEMALEDGDPQAAFDHLEAAARVDPGRPTVHLRLGVAALQLDRLERAGEALEAAAALSPDQPELNYYLAILNDRRGHPEEALQHYRAEVEINPANHRAWFNLGQLRADRGDHATAAEAFRQAITLDPSLAVAHLYLGRSLLAQEDPDLYAEAAAAARRALEIGPPRAMVPLGHFILADVYTRTGRTEAAQRELQKARAAQRRGGRGDPGR